MLTPHDGAGSRSATKMGQIAVVSTQLTAKARGIGVGPAVGSGELATPIVHSPVTASRRRAFSPTPFRPAAVVSWVPPTRNNAPVMIHRSVPGCPASALMVCCIGLYEAGWTTPATSQPPTSRTGHSAAETTVQPGADRLTRVDDAAQLEVAGDGAAEYVGWR